MTTYDWPADAPWTPMSGIFRVTTIAAMSSSPYTGAQKAASLGQIWRADLTWNNTALSQAFDMQGFLDQLEGPVNPVRLFDWWRSAPILLGGGNQAWSDGTFFDDGTGWADGYSPSLLAAITRGQKTFTLSGLPVSTECFRRGDLVGVGGYLYELRGGVTSNASGQALIIVQPGARAGAAIGDMVTLYRPTLPMRLVSDANSVINRSITNGEPFSLTFAEDIP